MGGYAWVTLATNNSYSLGALVLGHSLKKSNTAHKLVVLITSAVSESMRNQLGTVFDLVKLVDVLDSKDAAHLALMQRPELGVTFTKIHCWRLVEFEKCVFLDADTLVVRNCDELFEREEFSAAPDASWPDCFNSGVFVFRPSIDTFNKILQFAVENKSFDGGDQGLLNQFFSSWATEDIKKHLPFVYNLTSIGSYAYIPAFKHYGSETRIVHFIGTGKPWLQQLNVATKTVTPSSGYEHLAPLLQQWWDLFCEKVHPNLDKNLESSNEGMSHSPVEACSNSLPIALTDEPQKLPCTPLRETVVVKHNAPLITNDSSGESPKPRVLVITPEITSRIEKIEERVREDVKEAVEERNEEEKREQQEEPPPKDPFDYESFFPDETCIKSYLEQNVVTYQPFESQEEVKPLKPPEEVKPLKPPEEPQPLPRFLTIPEDDLRQSGNVDIVEKHEPERRTPEKETKPIEIEAPPREVLTKSKSMPYLPLELSPPEPPRSIWKSQPNVNIDPNRKYSMPKLKPILPKQRTKTVRTKFPKVTHYTEFLMSSEYKDPIDLPKDRIGFVATELHKHKRNKPNGRTKFGPLPFLPSPEMEKPACKKIRLEHSDDDLYDLTLCKRQSGNKPKQKDVEKKPNGNNLEEILKRLKEFSKDYLHYFGVVPKPRRRTVMSKNVIVQVGGEGECRSSEAFRTVRTGVCCWSRGTQTQEEFRWFRNYVKDQNEASQKGLLMISGKENVETRNDVGKNRYRRTKSVRHSENQYRVKGKQQRGDDVTTAQNNSVPLKLKQAERRTDGVDVSVQNDSVSQQFLQSNEDGATVKGPLHSKTALVTTAQNNGVLKSKKENLTIGSTSVASPRVPIPHPDSPSLNESQEKKTPEDFPTPQKSIKSKEDSASVESKKVLKNDVVSNSENLRKDGSSVASTKVPTPSPESYEKFVLDTEKKSSLDGREVFTTPQKPKDDASVKSEGVQTPYSESNKKPVARSKSSSNGEEKQQEDPEKDMVEEQKLEFSKDEANFSRVQTEDEESVAHSESNSKPAVEERQQDDYIETPLEVHLNSSKISPEVQSSTPRNEIDVVPPENQSESAVEVKQQDDYIITTPKTHLNFETSSTKSPEVRIPSPRNKEEDVPSKNDSKIVVKVKQQGEDEDQPLKLQQVENSTDGASVEIKLKEEKEDGDGVIVQNNGGLLLEQNKFLKPTKDGVEKESPKHENEEPTVHSKSIVEQQTYDVPNGFSPGSSSDQSPPPVVEQNGHTSEQLEKKPEEILCVPDFETPRSSRVTVKPTEPETPTPKPRKSRASPKRFGKDSPDESVRPGNEERERVEERKQVSGIAGAIAQLSLQAGSEETPDSTAASAAHQEYLRRQNWESGNIDYMGRDSFDNIWSKICQTLESKDQTTEKATVPEYIETLPGKPASGPVEDDEIIFSKGDSRQPGLMNISEEEEVGGNGVKLSDILGGGGVKAPLPSAVAPEAKVPSPVAVPQTTAAEVKPQPGATVMTPDSVAAGIKPQVVGVEIKTGAISAPVGGGVQLPAAPFDVIGQPAVTEVKSQPPAAVEVKPASVVTEMKEPTATGMKPETTVIQTKLEVIGPQSAGGEIKDQSLRTAEVKPQVTAVETKPESVVAAVQPTLPKAAEIKTQPATTETKPESPAVGIKSDPAATEIKAPTVTQSAGGESKPETLPIEGKTQRTTAETKPESVVPAVQPTAAETKPQPTAAETKPQPTAAETKPQPTATETKPDSTTAGAKSPQPIQPTGSETKPQTTPAEAKPTPTATDVKPQLPLAEVKTGSAATEVKSQPAAGEVKPGAPPTETATSSPGQTQPQTPTSPTGECKVVAIPSPPILPPTAHHKAKQPQPERPQVHSEPIPLPPPDSPSAEQSAKTPDSSKDDGKQKKGVFTKILEMVGVKEKNGNDGGSSVFYDVEKKEPETVPPKDSQSIQVSETKRKSPSPKLTMPSTPETAITTPTPPPTEEVPKRKNSALLKVEETILETPPVPEPSNIQTEIEDIIGKAKTEVETLLQEKEMVNTMKLIMGEEQEEVEELKVTSEEERKRHKGEVVSSKLSDQILKAIPPPRRKAISEAATASTSASASAIPKASNEQQKSPQPAEGKSKSSKPSSIPVPPPRNKGKPQPPPSKGKGKK